MTDSLSAKTVCGELESASTAYDVTLVADGHSTWDTPHVSAAQMIAQTNASLANIAHPTHDIVPKTATEISFSGS